MSVEGLCVSRQYLCDQLALYTAASYMSKAICIAERLK